jgi:serine/threonine protein kinase
VVAMKTVRKVVREMMALEMEIYLREAMIMSKMKHPNVVKYIDHF